jgi:hypothetical protein
MQVICLQPLIYEPQERCLKRVWRYQRGNHCKSKGRQLDGQIEKDQKKKQRFHLQKITQKTKDQVTRTPLKTDPAVILFSALCLFLFFYSLFRYISRATCIIRSPFIAIATVRLRSRKQSKRLTNTVQQELVHVLDKFKMASDKFLKYIWSVFYKSETS